MHLAVYRFVWKHNYIFLHMVENRFYFIYVFMIVWVASLQVVGLRGRNSKKEVRLGLIQLFKDFFPHKTLSISYTDHHSINVLKIYLSAP